MDTAMLQLVLLPVLLLARAGEGHGKLDYDWKDDYEEDWKETIRLDSRDGRVDWDSIHCDHDRKCHSVSLYVGEKRYHCCDNRCEQVCIHPVEVAVTLSCMALVCGALCAGVGASVYCVLKAAGKRDIPQNTHPTTIPLATYVSAPPTLEYPVPPKYEPPASGVYINQNYNPDF